MDADLMRLVFGETGAQEDLPMPDYWEARTHLRALLAVAKEARAAEILHPMHHAGAAPKHCAGCRLMRALARLAPPAARRKP